MNDGHFVYVLDDPYIHMTIARNFISNGFWATNGYTFTSATSSPLWTLLLSGTNILFNSNVWMPFILNIIFGFVAIYVTDFYLKKFNITKYRLLILLIFVFVSAFPAIIFTGMEHTAQILASLLLLFLSSRLIGEFNNNIKEIIVLLFLSSIVTGLRYEGMFLVSIVAVLFIVRKKYLTGLLLILFGLMPIIIYGLISVSNGWMFLPNTLLIKSKLPDFSIIEIMKIFFRAFKNILEPPLLFMFLSALYLIRYNNKQKMNIWTQKQLLLLVFVLTTILHMMFAQTGWFYRYEAYLVAMGVISVAINIYDYIPVVKNYKSKWKTIAFSLVILSFIYRSFSACLVPQSSYNIYEQHFQMGKFVNQYCSGINIAANDIGMINFYSNNKIVDLWGLANIDVGKYKISKSYNTKKINEVTIKNSVKLVMVYQHWFDQFGGLPGNWIKIGDWTLTDLNIVCGAITVDFYVLNPEDAVIYKNKLSEFSANLPGTVIYKIY